MKPPLLLLAPAVFAAAAFPQAPGPKGDPVAVVSGRPVYEDDVAGELRAQMVQFRKQEYEYKRRALETVLEENLLKAEAARRGMAVENFVAGEIYGKLPAPEAAELRAYYLGRQDLQGRPFEEVEAQLRAQYEQAQRQQARQAYLKSLREKAGVEILLEPPRVGVAVDKTRLKGPENAPITIVEFSDFECPFCGRVQGALSELLANHQGEIRVAFRDVPLSQLHPNARPAAEASRCAAEQGRFWPYHDLLFANSSNLNAKTLHDLAVKAGVDGAAFDACVSARKYGRAVEEDIAYARSMGITSTPTFFVNGILFAGAQPYTAFEKLVREELARNKRSGKRN